jgi:hypothetical protein
MDVGVIIQSLVIREMALILVLKMGFLNFVVGVSAAVIVEKSRMRAKRICFMGGFLDKIREHKMILKKSCVKCK